jgi:hypothetical protein
MISTAIRYGEIVVMWAVTLYGVASIFGPEDGGGMFLRNYSVTTQKITILTPMPVNI